jgi:hypothetical protein
LIGTTYYQMHRKSPIQQALWSSAKFYGTDSAHTLFLIQVVVGNAVHLTQQNVYLWGKRSVNLTCLLSLIRKYAQHTLLSIYPQWTSLGSHDMLSKPLLLLSQTFLSIYVFL